MDVADFRGGGRHDLLIAGFQAGQLTVAFDRRKVAAPPFKIALGDELTISGDLNCDGRRDVVGFQVADNCDGGEGTDPADEPAPEYPLTDPELGRSALKILYADDVGQLVPGSHLVSPPLGGSRRLLSADADGDGRAEPLLLVDYVLHRIPSDGSSRFDQLLSTDVPAGLVAGNIASGNWDPSNPCSEIALAERGGRAVYVHTLCANATTTKLPSVELPADRTIGARGVFSGDLNGDGLDDLIVTTKPAGDAEHGDCPDEVLEDVRVYVSYGVGDGTFHERPGPDAGSPGNGKTAGEPIVLPTALLAVADLDGDQRVDLVLEDQTLLSGRGFECPLGDLTCEHEFFWAAAVASDFNRDGHADVIGVPFDRRELTFALGLGGGRFNDFSVSTERAVATGSDECEPDALHALSRAMGVGDFNGDLTNDFAFVEPRGRDADGATLSVLFGVPLGAPSAPTRIVSMARIFDLTAGALFRGRNILSDLVVLAEESADDRAQQGLALLAGQTDRTLFSPLALPIDPETPDRVELIDVTLGRFRAHEAGAQLCPMASAGHARQELVLLARNERDEALLYFLANGEHGFESAAIADPERLPGDSRLWLETLDVDSTLADGVDEVIIYPSMLESSEFRYRVARRTTDGFSLGEFTSELRGLPVGQFAVDSPSQPRDIDGDGHRDLLLWLGDAQQVCDAADLQSDSYAVLLPNFGSGRLEPGTVMRLPHSSNLVFSFTVLNMDDDAALELAVATDDGVQLFDLPSEPAALAPHLKLGEGTDWLAVTAGDFDGDGIEDIAAVPYEQEDVQIFWGEERSR